MDSSTKVDEQCKHAWIYVTNAKRRCMLCGRWEWKDYTRDIDDRWVDAWGPNDHKDVPPRDCCYNCGERFLPEDDWKPFRWRPDIKRAAHLSCFIITLGPKTTKAPTS